MRNELLRLPFVLEYYRALGVAEFWVVDNDSVDGSCDWLAQQSDVGLYSVRENYADAKCGIVWLNRLLDLHSGGCWALVVDADELLVYLDSESIPLPAFCQRLDAIGCDAVSGFMLDMYSARPIRETHYDMGTPFLGACPFFDKDGYQLGDGGHYLGIPVRGGPRQRLFWSEGFGRGNPPFLGKLPLLKWRHGWRLEASTHLVKGPANVRQGCVILHFKMFSDFAESSIVESRREQHWDGAVQYKAYAERFSVQPGLSAYTHDSASYSGTRQLDELGLLGCVRKK